MYCLVQRTPLAETARVRSHTMIQRRKTYKNTDTLRTNTYRTEMNEKRELTNETNYRTIAEILNDSK